MATVRDDPRRHHLRAGHDRLLNGDRCAQPDGTPQLHRHEPQPLPLPQPQHGGAQQADAQNDRHHRLRQRRAQRRAGHAQIRPRQRKRAQLPRGEDQQGVEHHVQPAHEHQQYAGRPHISARLQQTHRQPVQLHKGQRQCEDQEIRGRARTDRAVRVEPVGKPTGDGTAHGGNKQPEGEPGAQPLLHQIPRVLFLACADALRHHDGKSHHQRSAQSAEQPRAGGHQSNGSRGVPPQLSHHGGVDVLHDDRRNLRQDRGEAQL